jgi:hypothetical protein
MSQCSRVLEVLRDGKPHSIGEIHERAGTMRLNSRVSDLRRMGYFIAYYRKDGLHTYQLLYGIVREAQGADSAVSDGNPGSRGPSRHGPPEHPSQTPSPQTDVTGGPRSRSLPREGHQLSVWEAA